MAPFKTRTIDQYLDKFELWKPNHTYWRGWPMEKLTVTLFGSYFLLRELPFRNFYARVWVMFFWWAKVSDYYKIYIPIPGA